jgi:FkbM family methyltransferase
LHRAQFGLPETIAAPLGETGLSVWVDLNDRFVAPGMLRNAWEPSETVFMCRQLKPGHVMIDIGAMMGWFALNAAAIVGPSGAVHAFEPQPRMHGLLRRSVFANRLERFVETYELAVWDAPGLMHLAGDGVTTRGPGNKGHTWVEAEAAATNAALPTCRAARLDDVVPLRKVDFVKIDAEGAEYRVILGGERLLRSSRPIVMCELFPEQLQRVSGVEPDALLDIMRSWGFTPCSLDNNGGLQTWTSGNIPRRSGAYTTVVFV